MAPNYEAQLAAAPATNPELLKSALLAIVADIQKRLINLEPPLPQKESNNGS